MGSVLQRYPNLPSIEAHLEQLRLQQRDAEQQLSQPEAKPGLHSQIKALLKRIDDERAGLEQAVTEVFGAGSRF